MAVTTVASSRMSKEQAREALTVVRIQQATHTLTCARCYQAAQAKKQRATNWALWVMCDAMRDFRRVQSALEHRLAYLRMNAVKKAAAAHGLSPWQFQKQQPQEYRALVREYEIESERS